MLQSGAVWWRGDLLQRRRSTPSSAYPVYRVERQDQQPHGTLGAGRGEQWVEVELSWAWACAAKIVVVEGFIIRDPSSFSTACLDLPFRAREATGHKAGMRWAFAVEAEPITGPACANGGCSAQTKPQAPSQGVTSGRRVRPAVSPVISAVSLLGNRPLHCPFCPFCPRCPRCPRFPHCPPLLLAGATRATDEASCSLHCCSCFGLALTRRDRFKERTSAAWQCLHRLIALAESSEH